MTRIFRPHEVVALTGISSLGLRDRRRRGLLHGTGIYVLAGRRWTEDPNHPDIGGRPNWGFSREDVLVLIISDYLTGHGFDLKAATPIAVRILPKVLACFGGLSSPGGEASPESPLAVAWEDRHGELHVEGFADLANLARFPTPVAFLIDSRVVAERLRNRIADVMEEADDIRRHFREEKVHAPGGVAADRPCAQGRDADPRGRAGAHPDGRGLG